MILATFEIEQQSIGAGYQWAIGIDEAGRGPLAGPVVAAAAVYRDSSFAIPQELEKKFALVRDSKTLSEKKREELFDFIHEHFLVGVGLSDHLTIDRINILEATYLAMKKAVSDLQHKLNFQASAEKCIVLVDGNKLIPNFSFEQKAIVGGDRLVKSIAAASIVAKVTRDRIMKEADEKYPQYGFLKHKGYGTKAHVDAIRAHGPCEIHRRSFEPIATLVKTHK